MKMGQYLIHTLQHCYEKLSVHSKSRMSERGGSEKRGGMEGERNEERRARGSVQ